MGSANATFVLCRPPRAYLTLLFFSIGPFPASFSLLLFSLDCKWQIITIKDFVADFELVPVVPDIRMPQVLYELGSAELLPQSKDSLNFLYQTLSDNGSIVVELNSHTDSRGDAAKNVKLSQDRAQSCVNYLVNEKKINPARLTAKGYGKTQLLIGDDVIAKAKTTQEKEALHALNRRTAFRILNWDFVDPNAPKTPTKLPVKKAADDEEDEE